MSALSPSADAPLQRGSGKKAIFFDTATVTLSGVLPPGFSGVARARVMGIFRALEIVLSPGRYRFVEGKVLRVAPSDAPWVIRVKEPRAVEVGGSVEAFLENPSAEPEPFEIKFRGHSAEPWRSGPPSFQEYGTPTILEARGKNES